MDKDLKIFAEHFDDKSLKQIHNLLDQEAFKSAKVRIMPDVHAGAGCVIGFTADLGNKVIPNVVGVDIGCGMYTVKLGKIDINLKELDKFITENIPCGFKINQNKKAHFIEEIEDIKCFREIPKSSKEFNRGIGSLGGGNHFIEVAIDGNENKYLIIHSGSRNFGHQIASYYQKRAIDYHSGLGEEYLENREKIIEEFKKQGRRKEIQNALQDLYNENKQSNASMPNNLCYLEGKLREDYLHDMDICQKYAELNRETMANTILDYIFPTRGNLDSFHTIHNYIDFDTNIVRKGAISANKDEIVLIPINMRDGSILAKGKGNPDWNYSAPHGAGRLMSRSQAKENIILEEFKDTMKDVYSTSVCKATIDEAPMAYKSLNEILTNITDTVDVLSILKPIYNFKAK